MNGKINNKKESFVYKLKNSGIKGTIKEMDNTIIRAMSNFYSGFLYVLLCVDIIFLYSEKKN